MPSRASKEAKRGPSSTRPKKRRPKPRPSGTTASGKANIGGGLAGTKGSGTAKVTRPKSSGSNGRPASPTSTIDPALLANATTGLTVTPEQRAQVSSRLGQTAGDVTWADVAELTGVPGAARALGDLSVLSGPISPLADGPTKQTTIPGVSDSVDLLTTLTAAGLLVKAGKGGKGVKDAEKAAQTAQKESQAAKVARGGQADVKGGRVKRSNSELDRLEKATVKRRIKANRAKMTKTARAKDVAKGAKTRAQAKLYDEALKITAGTGTAGAGALSAREIAKQSGSKGAAARALAKEGAKRTATAPVRAGAALNRAALSPAALPVTGVVPAEEKARNLASLPFQLGAATVENPGAVAQASLQSGRDMLLGAPAAVYEMATNPSGALEMMKQDYVSRYGPLLEGDFKYFRDQVAENGGLTPYGLDALIVAPPAGRVVGAAGRSGALGKGLQTFMTKERPGLFREAGSVAREQALSKNAVGVGAQRTMDVIRARKTRKGAEKGNAFLDAANQPGVVAPIRANATQARNVAARKARTRAINLAQQGRVMRTVALLMSRLSQDQSKAVKWALALGIRTADQAKEQLPARIAAIKAARAAETDYGPLDNIPEIEQVIAQADEIFTPEFGQTIDQFRRAEKRLAVGDPVKSAARRDPALDIEQAANRRVAQQAEHLGIERLDGESNADYIARVRQTAKEAGLAEAGYFPSELSRRRRFSQMATGGTRHSERTKAYTGALFREGIENNDPSVLLRGFQRNVKRRNSWEMVSEIYERNSLPWSRDRTGQGLSQAEILKEANKRGLDESSFVLANPGLLRRAGNVDMEPGKAQSGSNDFGNAYMDDLSNAIKTSTEAAETAGFDDLKGWYAVPTKVLDELESSMHVGKVGRGADIAMSKMSGYLLAGNTGWLGFQTISTAAQAAIGGVTPASWVLAQIMWHRMRREAKGTGARTGLLRRRVATSSREMLGSEDFDRFNAYAGISQAADFQNPPQMGAKIQGNGLIGGAVEGHRIFREGKWGQALHKVNPIQAWFKLSQIPENASRRALAYKILKSNEIKRMNVNLKKTDAAINRITQGMKLDPNGQIRAAMKDTKQLEDMSQGLADFLGDYQTFTAIERSILKRSIPFYSWMRFATKFALFTLPSKHPIAAGLTYQLGRLESDQLRDVLGDAMGWALGKTFLGDPQDPNTPFIDMYRGNPLLSGLVEFEDTRDLMGFVPPYIALIGNQIWGRNYFTRSDLTVDGETMPRRFSARGLSNELQIGLNQWLSTFTPYRVAGEIAAGGTPMTDDAFPVNLPFGLGGPEPKRYAPGSGEETKAREEGEFRQDGGAGGVLLKRMAPFFPQSSSRLRQQGNYINAETKREQEAIREYQQRTLGGGDGASGAASVMDQIRDRMESASPAQDVMDKIKERLGQ